MDFSEFSEMFSKFINKKVYVGFSGGSDSTAVLVLANHFKYVYGYELYPINFEHGIRGEESIKDSESCNEFCLSLGLNLRVISLNLSKDTPNVECVARTKRLKNYSELITDKENSVVLLGHHMDDRIENFFIRISRGANISGLFGLSQSTEIYGVKYFRPLFNHHKNEIERFLMSNKINWRIDSTNSDDYYSRNYIRNVILPGWYSSRVPIKSGIKTCMNNLEIDNDFIKSVVELEFNKIRTESKLKIEYFTSLHEAIRNRILRLWIMTKDPEYIIRKGTIDQFNKMIQVISKNSIRRLSLTSKLELEFRSEYIYIRKKVK